MRDGPCVPSKTWRELIKKVWEVDPLTCPRCGSEMRIISLIQDPDVIRQILKHLGLWKQDAGSRCKKPKPDHGPVVYEEFDDGWPVCEEVDFHRLAIGQIRAKRDGIQPLKSQATYFSSFFIFIPIG